MLPSDERILFPPLSLFLTTFDPVLERPMSVDPGVGRFVPSVERNAGTETSSGPSWGDYGGCGPSTSGATLVDSNNNNDAAASDQNQVQIMSRLARERASRARAEEDQRMAQQSIFARQSNENLAKKCSAEVSPVSGGAFFWFVHQLVTGI